MSDIRKKTNNSPDDLFRKLFHDALRWKDWIISLWPKTAIDNYESSSEYQEALNYYQQFQQQEGVDYSEAIAYAKETMDRCLSTEKCLDDKADSIIRYLGGGLAFVSFGTLVSIKTDSSKNAAFPLLIITTLLPSFILGLLAVLNAIKCRQPANAATLPSIKFAVEMTEYHKSKDKIELNLWLILYPISEAIFHRNLRKSKTLEKSHVYYIWSMGCLLFPVGSAAIYLYCCS